MGQPYHEYRWFLRPFRSTARHAAHVTAAGPIARTSPNRGDFVRMLSVEPRRFDGGFGGSLGGEWAWACRRRCTATGRLVTQRRQGADREARAPQEHLAAWARRQLPHMPLRCACPQPRWRVARATRSLGAAETQLRCARFASSGILGRVHLLLTRQNRRSYILPSRRFGHEPLQIQPIALPLGARPHIFGHSCPPTASFGGATDATSACGAT